ncbi:MAG TPA: GTP-binding protein, partial [Candidatus Ozemobacteraceae bacterium]|nr:GTP-binding protein [Candidatus Ozemobacteraceae bacterium]
ANEAGREDLQIVGGGGGVILPQEGEELQKYGVTRIYSPEDGRKLGLLGMISDILRRTDHALAEWPKRLGEGKISWNEPLRLARALTLLENNVDALPAKIKREIEKGRRDGNLDKNGFDHKAEPPLVLGVTGPGGAGKSSLTDELIRRFLLDFPDRRLCIFSIDPSKRKTGGALLGDRIRMNAINSPNVFMRSFATRGSRCELNVGINDAISLARQAGFDLIIVETSGIGQGDTGILNVSDAALYVMTGEFGAPMQLEKIDMLDFADLVAINKFDRRGSEDAYRDVVRQMRRSRFHGKQVPENECPVFGTMASKYHDDGMNGLYRELLTILNRRCGQELWKPHLELKTARRSSAVAPVIPQNRTQYLSEIADTVREYHQRTDEQMKQANLCQSFDAALTQNLSESAREEIR